MKVLNVIGSLDKSAGGPSRSVPQSCTELAKIGIQIEIICRPSPDPILVFESENMKVRFTTIRQLYSFAHNLKPKDIDLIHLQHVWDPYIHVMARAARRKGIPYMITPRGMLEPWIMKHNAWKKKLAMALYQRNDFRKASLIHATAQMEADNIRKLEFTNQIEVIPNGIDLLKVPEPKTEYGSKKVVFLSRIHPKKGIELLLEAWKGLQTKDWTLEIAGDGDPAYIDQIYQKISREKLDSVKLVGPQYGSAKWDFLKSADLFVLPSYSENFGIVVAEALAVGVPVITTTGAPWQELEIYNCGWWIDLSVVSLKSTINEAIQTKPKLLKKMGLEGIKLVKEKYDIVVVALEIKRMYLNICQ